LKLNPQNVGTNQGSTDVRKKKRQNLMDSYRSSIQNPIKWTATGK